MFKRQTPAVVDALAALRDQDALETEKNRQIVEPVGKALGKVFKRQTPAVVDALAALRDQDALALLAKIETQGKAELNIEGGSVEILAGMVRRYETSSDAERSSIPRNAGR